MIKVYGIPNCNTVKNAINYIKDKNKSFEFHNFKKDSISEEKLKEWFAVFGLEKVVNKKSRVYRNLSDEEKALLDSENTAPAVLQQYTSIIKRPVIEYNNQYALGFVTEEYDQILG